LSVAFSSGGRGIKNDINVTPLVDVVLVLLIIFMVVTPMLERGKDVELPKAATRDEEEEADALVISVLADRTVWVELSQVGVADLPGRLTAAVSKAPERKILIKADQSLHVRDVRPVMNAAQAAGARGVSFAVEELAP
jgi:biopolymer transport protein TolR